MSQFLLLLRGGDFEKYSEAEQQKIVQRYAAWVDELKKQGIYKAAEPLTNHGRILRVEGRQIVDGPFTETKEAVGGFFSSKRKTTTKPWRYRKIARISIMAGMLSYAKWLSMCKKY